MAAATRLGGDTPVVVLISSDYIKDFLMKEDYFERKLPVATFPVNAGVMFEHLHKNLEIRRNQILYF